MHRSTDWQRNSIFGNFPRGFAVPRERIEQLSRHQMYVYANIHKNHFIFSDIRRIQYVCVCMIFVLFLITSNLELQLCINKTIKRFI